VACDAHCAQGGDDIVGAETLPAKVCLGANCLLKDVGCPEGESCYRFNGPFLCAPTGEAPAGAACERPNDCATGSICVGLNDSFACRLLCDGDGRPACEEVCSDGFRDASEDPLVRYCR
jgi:hypothetical protein